MRTLTALLLLSLTAALLVGCCAANRADAGMTAASPHDGHLRHVVVFKFKEDATPEQVTAIERHFARLPDEIPEIIDYEWGTNNSPEGLNRGFTHCFLVTFADEAGRAVYLPHPAHKKFVEHLKPILEEAFVIDYVAKPE